MSNLFGIVGGHGAVATLQFHQLLTSKVLAAGAFKDEDFPNLIITNISGNIINEQGEIDDREKLKKLLTTTAAIFTQAETTHTVILCNTFHSEHKFMEQVFSGQMLLLPELVKKVIKTTGSKKPLVVASQITIDHKLYEDSAYTTKSLYADTLIEAGMKGQTMHPLLHKLVEKAEQEQADSIILGCTDLSVFHTTLQNLTQIPVIDSLEAAADTIFAIHESGRK